MARDRGLVSRSDDEGDVKTAGAISKRQRFQEVEDLKAALSDPLGRRLMWRLLGQAGMFESGFSTDPLVMAARAGKRDYGVWLYNEIEEADASAMSTMSAEAKARRASQQAEAEAARVKRGSPENEDDDDER